MRTPTITYQNHVNTPFGPLCLSYQQEQLVKIDFSAPTVDKPLSSCVILENLKAYLADPTTPLPIIALNRGTAFQKRVWHALKEIPLGTVKTYGQLAQELGTGPRAVGQACRTNPLPIIYPCHRVIAADGLGGYSGRNPDWNRIKAWLLTHEKVDLGLYGRTKRK